MTLNIYLLFFTLFFSLVLYIYVLYINEKDFKLTTEEFNNVEELAPANLHAVNHSIAFNNQEAFMSTQRKAASIKCEKRIEIKHKLKKYNQQLNRCLKTLTYISVVEVDSLTKKNQLKNLRNLKANVQYEVVRITKQINHCKSLLEDSIPA